MLVDFSDLLVGHGLDLLLHAVEVILGDVAVFLAFFDGFKTVPTGGAHAHTGVFTQGLSHLHHLFAAFLGEGGNRQADHLAFDAAVQTQA